MSATVSADSDADLLVGEARSEAMKPSAKEEKVEPVKCDCCGLVEDCTLAFKEATRERFGGKWLCGLCGEAVKDEVVRAEGKIGTEEAMTRHMSFCNKFKSSNPPPHDPTLHLISAMRQVLKRTLDSPTATRSTGSAPASPLRTDGETGPSGELPRSKSWFPTL